MAETNNKKRTFKDIEKDESSNPLFKTDKTKELVKSSLIRDDENAFPRGGASALTPLELKRVANEAASDVLFSNKSSSSEPKAAATKTVSATFKRVKANKFSDNYMEVDAENEDEENESDMTEKFQHLSYKTIPTGSILLGMISKVSKYGLSFEFEDGLFGYCPIENISSSIFSSKDNLDSESKSQKGDENSDVSEFEDSDAESDDDDEVPLESMFKSGEYYKCKVLKNLILDGESKNSKKSGKKLIVSLDPSAVNSGLDETDLLQKGLSVQVSIKSIEDHGCVMDCGVENNTVSIFMPINDIDSSAGVRVGNVFLSTVSKVSGRAITVTLKAQNALKPMESINSLDSVITGSYVNLLVDSIKSTGVYGKVFGTIPAILNLSQIESPYNLSETFKVGDNIPVRIISKIEYKGFLFLHVSELNSVVNLDTSSLKSVEDSFPIGFRFDDNLSVVSKDSSYVYVRMTGNVIGYIHYSKLQTNQKDLTQSIKPTRVVSYNPFNNKFALTNLKEQIENEYLTIKDIPIGSVLQGEVREVNSSKGVTLRLMNNFVGKVLIKDLSDIKLNYPERKFKIGSKVKGRVLSINMKNGQVMMSLRKQLVNNFNDDSNLKILGNFEDAAEGVCTLATVDSFNTYGCTVKFFNNLRGFIPKGEVSDAFVKDASKFLKENQIIKVKILEVDASKNRIIATCKLNTAEEVSQLNELIDKLVLGRSLVECIVVEKTKDSVIVELNENRLIRGVVYVGHISDQRTEQNRNLLKKISIGDSIDALVIDKDDKTKVINLSMKQSLIKSAKEDKLPTTFNEISATGQSVPMFGYIKSISPSKGIFVAFNGKFVGLVLPSHCGVSRDADLSTIFYQDQSVKVFLLRTDPENQRFLLTFVAPANEKKSSSASSSVIDVINPIDPSIKSTQDFIEGKQITVSVKSIKNSQLNCIISDNIHGRVDLTQIFPDIKSVSHLQKTFTKGSKLSAYVVGYHNVKSSKFLPVSNKFDKNTLVELSLVSSSLKDFSEYKKGDIVTGYANNIIDNLTWVSVSPSVKGKVIKSKNIIPLNQLQQFEVTAVDKEHSNLTLAAVTEELDLSSLSTNDKLQCQVLKVFDSYVLLNVKNTDQRAISFITDSLPDFSSSTALTSLYTEGQEVTGTVKEVNVEDKKLKLSLIDKPQVAFESLESGSKVFGLVKKVTKNGVFFYLSSELDCFIPVSKISDSFLKDWARQFQPLTAREIKIVSCETESTILGTLRESELNGELKITKGFEDVAVGEIFDGVVRNVTEFGVFIKLNGVENVVGLAHRQEITDDSSALEGKELTDLFGEGDVVRCYVIKKNPSKKQVSLSLKGSRFKDVDNDIDMDANEDEDNDVMDVDFNESESDSEPEEDLSAEQQPELSADGLSLSAGFDWTGKILSQVQENNDEDSDSDSETEDFTVKKATSDKKNKIVDKTISLSTDAPESNADFERIILSDPNNSVNWLNYTAFQLTVGEIDKAREILERALNTINYREEQEKLNIWVAKLNLEFSFGDSETLHETFSKACSYMDDYVVHLKLLMIYQSAGKVDEADKLFLKALKKFGNEKPQLWEKYGEFLLINKKNEEAHLLLARALKQLPKRDHIGLVKKFAQLEYAHGEVEQGRSLIEGLLADAPKRIDLWNIYLDLEIKLKEKRRVEELFERCISNPKLNKKQAKYFFKKWVEFEENCKDSKMVDYVAAKASEYIRNNN